MHALILFTICWSTLVEVPLALLNPPHLLRFVPEFASCVATLIVLVYGVRSGFVWVAPKYWIAFGVAAFILVAGIIVNSVQPGAIITGTRFYARAMPLFCAGAVYPFTDKQIRQQLALLLAVGFVQLPVAAAQRYVVYSQGRYSGDAVSGTLGESGVLSIVLICAALVLLGFYMRGRLSGTRFAALFIALLLPTTINETKATILLLPLGLLTTIVAGSPPRKRLRTLAVGVSLMVVFGSIMVPIYDFFEEANPYKNERNLVDFFTSQKQIDSYMETTKTHVELGNTNNVRRGDAYRVPFQYLSRDPVELAFGLGMGNATSSNLGPEYSGRYADLFAAFSQTSFSVFLIETGLLGTAAVFVLYWLVFGDALAVAKADSGLMGALAIGWIGVVAVMAASTFYATTHLFSSLSYLYWYFSGIIASRRTQLALAAQRSRLRVPGRRATA